MPQQTDSANTPRYVLKSGNLAVHPTIKFDDPGANCVCVYGFSDRKIFDQFIESTEQLLTPYPLVQGYLENRIAETDSQSNGDRTPAAIVILDAVSMEDANLSAAPMAAVLLAQQEKTKQVQTEFRLTLDPSTKEYRFDQ